MEPIFFETQEEMHAWFCLRYKTESEVLVGFYKKGSGMPSVSWPESVDVALCFGWIDGVRKSMDKDRYTIRFTPRRPNSIWSKININKMELLISYGLVTEEGLVAYSKRDEKRSRVYSYENELAVFSEHYEKLFKENEKAWAFFVSQAPSYQKVMKHLIMRAKMEPTRERKLLALIEACEQGRRLL